jgi:hypothetical protein
MKVEELAVAVAVISSRFREASRWLNSKLNSSF